MNALHDIGNMMPQNHHHEDDPSFPFFFPIRKRRRVSFNKKLATIIATSGNDKEEENLLLSSIPVVNASETTTNDIDFDTKKEEEELWYREEDINKFKNEVRSICRILRHHEAYSIPSNIPMDVIEVPSSSSLISSSSLSILPFENDNNIEDVNESLSTIYTRGLEQRVSIERQRYRLVAVRATLGFYYNHTYNGQNNKHSDKNCHHHEEDNKLASVSSFFSKWARSVALKTGHKDFYAVYHPKLLNTMPEIQIDPFPLLNKTTSVIITDDDDDDNDYSNIFDYKRLLPSSDDNNNNNNNRQKKFCRR